MSSLLHHFLFVMILTCHTFLSEVLKSTTGKLASQFQKKSWANKLHLRKKLYSLILKEGDSVQQHIRKLTEIFEELAVVGNPIEEEDKAVHLLASLPESYSMLVTALEANPEVPKMEVVTERLLHEERKQKDKEGSAGPFKALIGSGKPVRCFHCNKMGHAKKNCRWLTSEYGKGKKKQESARQGQHSVS